jgi:hypothetical protein
LAVTYALIYLKLDMDPDLIKDYPTKKQGEKWKIPHQTLIFKLISFDIWKRCEWHSYFFLLPLFNRFLSLFLADQGIN